AGIRAEAVLQSGIGIAHQLPLFRVVVAEREVREIRYLRRERVPFPGALFELPERRHLVRRDVDIVDAVRLADDALQGLDRRRPRLRNRGAALLALTFALAEAHCTALSNS